MDTVNDVLSRFTGDLDSPPCQFPFSRKIGKAWFDIATDGHRIHAIAAKDPHYSTTVGPGCSRVEALLARPPRVGGMLNGLGLIKDLKADAEKVTQLRQGKKWARVNRDYLVEALETCAGTVSITVQGPRDAVRIDGVLRGTKSRVIAIIMPIHPGADLGPAKGGYRLPVLGKTRKA